MGSVLAHGKFKCCQNFNRMHISTDLGKPRWHLTVGEPLGME